MANELSKTEANKRVEALKTRLRNMRERSGEEAKELAQSATVGVSAIALGMLDRKMGPALVAGVDNSMLLAGLGLVSAATGFGGEYTPYLRAAGNAGLAITGYKWGAEMVDEATTASRGAGGRTAADDIRAGT